MSNPACMHACMPSTKRERKILSVVARRHGGHVERRRALALTLWPRMWVPPLSRSAQAAKVACPALLPPRARPRVRRSRRPARARAAQASGERRARERERSSGRALGMQRPAPSRSPLHGRAPRLLHVDLKGRIAPLALLRPQVAAHDGAGDAQARSNGALDGEARGDGARRRRA